MKTAPKIPTPYIPVVNKQVRKTRITSYETMTEAIEDLKRKGYTNDFNILTEKDCLICNKTDLELSPEEFQIDQTYRFEGETDPGDEMIVFAISSLKHKVKGIVVNAFGTYADSGSSEIVAQLLQKPDKQNSPIKRHPALVQLSRDHHFGLLLVWKIRQGLKRMIDPKRISNYVLFFYQEDLRPHFNEEENQLFVKLPDQDKLKIKAINDHKEIYLLIAAIDKEKENISLLTKFSDKLEEHIRFEERNLFNYLQEKLSNKELEELTRFHTKKSINPDEKWEDDFWTFKR